LKRSGDSEFACNAIPKYNGINYIALSEQSFIALPYAIGIDIAIGLDEDDQYAPVFARWSRSRNFQKHALAMWIPGTRILPDPTGAE